MARRAEPAPRLTRNQGLVLACLERAHAPLGAYDILAETRGEGIRAPLQVYRALDRLIALGLVHRIESLNAFIHCGHDHRGASAAFAICRQCGTVTEFTDAALLEGLARWADRTSFEIDRTTLEVRGLCALCAEDR